MMRLVAFREEASTLSTDRISLSAMPDSVLVIIAGYLEDSVANLPVLSAEEINEEQEEIFDDIFYDFFYPDQIGCDGFCCFPSTAAATSKLHRFARQWDPEPIMCQLCKPEDAWIKMSIEWDGSAYYQNRLVQFIGDHGLTTAGFTFADDNQLDLHLRNPLINGPRPIWLSIMLPKGMSWWQHQRELEKRVAWLEKTYHLYGIERDAMTMMTKTYNLWAMIASARIYNKTPTWYYHRALGALNKIDRRESRGQLAYTDSSPTVRYTSLPREVRGRVKDFLKAITEQDEIARCGTDWIAGDLDWTYPTDVIREASMIEFDDLFFKYFCRSVSERKHACGSLFPGENYDTEHGFFRHWDPLRKLSCVFNCTPLQIWQSISLKLMLNVTDKTLVEQLLADHHLKVTDNDHCLPGSPFPHKLMSHIKPYYNPMELSLSVTSTYKGQKGADTLNDSTNRLCYFYGLCAVNTGKFGRNVPPKGWVKTEGEDEKSWEKERPDRFKEALSAKDQ